MIFMLVHPTGTINLSVINTTCRFLATIWKTEIKNHCCRMHTAKAVIIGQEDTRKLKLILQIRGTKMICQSITSISGV